MIRRPLPRDTRKRAGAPLEAPRSGRYAILGTLGAGAMGVVHAAFDVEVFLSTQRIKRRDLRE